MNYRAPLIAFLLERPTWSNAAIARRIGCEQRRVRLYRRRLAECGAAPDEVGALALPELGPLLHPRTRKPVPDFAALRAGFPHATVASLWRAHVVEASRSGGLALSRSHFMRLFQEWELVSAHDTQDARRFRSTPTAQRRGHNEHNEHNEHKEAR